MLLTVEGAEYYLGFRKEATPEERKALVANQVALEESAALGLVEDMLAV